MADQLLERLLRRLAEREATPIPTSTLSRLARTASASARIGLGLMSKNFRGDGPLDVERLEAIVLSLGELKGLAMKMGQMLSYLDSSLTPEARRLLGVLQVSSQPTPWADIEAIVRVELGEAAPRLLATMDRSPAACASIGQVHRATVDGVPVAVKVRHPGIDDAIRADFRGAAVGKLLAGMLAPGAAVAEHIEEARTRFLEECDYALELKRQTRFAALFAGHPDVRVPAPLPALCGPRVLTTRWHDGATLDTFVAQAPQAARDRAGGALYEFYVGTLYRHGLFNADPHPGNLLFEPDGAVTVLDHGCAREFEPGMVTALKALSRATRSGNEADTRAALRAMGATPPNDAGSFSATVRLLRGFFAPSLVAGAHALTPDANVEARRVIADKRLLFKLRLPAELLFLFRIRFGLYAVLARLGSVRDWQALERALTF